ncbi:hypothetical protein H2200_011585 [Cladophialophora chaetospira]|uniref:Uncharacterized protein n=1 Tax=Cladophialophora chaetospira TaxID=386627 RepID=A0AA38WZL3_9EURO|nr:hypothetical protein H2200_011585 [Cladophialophora chaetospira]
MCAEQAPHADEHTRFDVIIVGGGTAGCVLASRLSAQQHLKILLLEAGVNRNDDINVCAPGLSRIMMRNPDYDWDFVTTPQVELENRVIYQTRGRMIGGSSAINSHCLLFPSKSMHDTWAKLCDDDRWSWEQMKDCYRRFMQVQTSVEASAAEDVSDEHNLPRVQASYPRKTHILSQAWEDVFEGVGALCDYEGQVEVGVGGLTCINAIDGRPGKGERSHAGKAYLAPVLGRPNLVIVEGALVERIVIEERKAKTGEELHATGVLYRQAGRLILASAELEVVLCAGVFGSPQILELSGIGHRDVLARANIECLLDLPGVGENLQDHLNYGPSVEVRPEIDTLDERRRSSALREQCRKEYEESRQGPYSEGGAHSFAYWPLQIFNSPSQNDELRRLLEEHPPKSGINQIQYDFVRDMITEAGEASATVFMTRIQRYTKVGEEAEGNYISVIAMLSHPFSRGSSHIRDSVPRSHPVINNGYLTDPFDVEILARHVLQIEQLLEQPALAAVLRPNGNRLPADFSHGTRTLDAAKPAIKKYGATNYHSCGTCAMMRPDLGGVVGGDLRVHGVSNLRICDASMFPIIPRANILSTVYAVAEKAAEIILQDFMQRR